MLTVQGDVRTLMTRLLNVQTHPDYYEHVVLDTLLDSKDFVFQRYHFTYTKNIGKWIPAFLVPNLLRVQNDSSFDFVHNVISFCIQPVGKPVYRVEGRVLFHASHTENVHVENVQVEILLDSVVISVRGIPSWVRSRLRTFIVEQMVDDLRSMILVD
jgi:hypothetical protein